MRNKRIPRVPQPAVILLFILGIAFPLSGQTLLLFVQESAAGVPLAPPLAVREGIAAALFAAGVIVVEVPPAYDRPKDPAAFAREAGADLLLDVAASYAETSAGANGARVTVRTTFTLIDVETGATLAQSSLDATNADRETSVDSSALGGEIGAWVAGSVEKAIAAWTS